MIHTHLLQGQVAQWDGVGGTPSRRIKSLGDPTAFHSFQKTKSLVTVSFT